MSVKQPRTLRTVTGAGGTSETYDLAVDPTRSTLDTAVRVAKLAEAARIDALFTADLLRFDAQGAIGEENYGNGELPSPEERYARAAETLEVVGCDRGAARWHCPTRPRSTRATTTPVRPAWPR
ncbi:hypothetical protein [Streptomyces antibioticus]|uniref:hypothetical protein n=1 Tax=Streptomyces antibioticus TaxID=1890 RepID=UPI0033AB9A4E